MLTAEKRALANYLGDKLIELYVERAEAARDGDSERERELQTEIDEASAERREILDGSKPIRGC